MAVIAIDFDGTLCEHKFPDIGQEVPGAFAVLKELQAAGHKLILWTMRNDRADDGPYLTEALKWCKERGIEFWSANSNPEQHTWSESPKCYAHYYIDDASICCPLRPSFMVDRPMVDWVEIRKLMVERKLIQG